MADETRVYDLMGGDVEIVLYDIARDDVDRLYESILSEEARLEKIFNFFDTESELSRLNQERSIEASEELNEVISKSIKYSLQTGGRYDVTLGKAINARKNGAEYQTASSFKDLEISVNRIILNHDDIQVDLGSNAKGYIVDRLVEHMKKIGIHSGLIDARGDMRTYGKNIEIVDIQNPRETGKTMKSIVLDNLAIATSGDYIQFSGSYLNSHIIGCDSYSSVSVVADSLFLADSIASCISVMQPTEVGAFLATQKDVKVLAYGKDMTEYDFNDFRSLYPEVYANAF